MHERLFPNHAEGANAAPEIDQIASAFRAKQAKRTQSLLGRADPTLKVWLTEENRAKAFIRNKEPVIVDPRNNAYDGSNVACVTSTMHTFPTGYADKEQWQVLPCVGTASEDVNPMNEYPVVGVANGIRMTRVHISQNPDERPHAFQHVVLTTPTKADLGFQGTGCAFVTRVWSPEREPTTLLFCLTLEYAQQDGFKVLKDLQGRAGGLTPSQRREAFMTDFAAWLKVGGFGHINENMERCRFAIRDGLTVAVSTWRINEIHAAAIAAMEYTEANKARLHIHRQKVLNATGSIVRHSHNGVYGLMLGELQSDTDVRHNAALRVAFIATNANNSMGRLL